MYLLFGLRKVETKYSIYSRCKKEINVNFNFIKAKSNNKESHRIQILRSRLVFELDTIITA